MNDVSAVDVAEQEIGKGISGIPGKQATRGRVSSRGIIRESDIKIGAVRRAGEVVLGSRELPSEREDMIPAHPFQGILPYVVVFKFVERPGI